MKGGWLEGHRLFLVILVFSAAVRVAGFLAAEPWDLRVQQTVLLQKDAYEYHSLALEMARDRTFSNPIRSPGYPGFIALVYAFSGVRPEAVILVQLLLGLLALTLLYAMTIRLFSKAAGVAAALFYALDPLPVFYSLNVLSETLFSLVFLAACALYLFGVRDGKKGFVFLAGLLFGLSMLIRPVAQYFPFLAVLLLLFTTGIPPGNRLKGSLLVVIGSLIVISPWLAHNYQHYRAVALTSQKGEGLLLYNAALMESWRTGRPYEAVRDELARETDARLAASGSASPFDKSRLQTEYAQEIILSHPGAYLVVHLRGMANTFISPDTRRMCAMFGIRSHGFPDGFVAVSSLKEKIAAFFRYKPWPELLLGLYIIILSGFAYACAALGCIALYRRKELFLLALFLSVIIYFSAITGPFGYSRYKVPVIPFYTMIGAYGLCSARNLFTRKTTSQGLQTTNS